MVSRSHELGREDILRSMAPWGGVTTAAGAADGSTLFDNALIGSNDFITDKTILILTGNNQYKALPATAFNSVTGQITVQRPYFNFQVLRTTAYLILNIELPLARIGDPTGDTLANLTAKWGDIARSLDLILGNRWDVAGDLGTDIAAIIAGLIITVMQQGLCYYGEVTAVPGANQFTIPGLAGYGNTAFANWTSFVFWDAAGGGAAPQGESQAVAVYTSATGVFQTAAYTAPVAVGDKILILHPRIADIATILTAVQAIQARTDNLAGVAPQVGATIANWNSGVATSGAAGGDVCTIGANDTRYKLHSALVSMRNLTPAATITVRAYMEVNGVEDEVYNQTFVQGTDPDGIWWCNGTVEIHEAVRVELHSNAGADDGASVPYDNSLEAM